MSVMAAHPGDYEVQKRACYALFVIADAVDSSALHGVRASRAAELLTTAKKYHEMQYDDAVSKFANLTLAKLAGP